MTKMENDFGEGYRPVRYVKRRSRFISGDPNNYPSCITEESRSQAELDNMELRANQTQIQNEEGYEDRRRRKILSKLANVYEVSKSDKQKFIQDISRMTKEVRDFIVLEIAPLEIAVEAAIEEAAESLEIITSTSEAQVDSSYIRKVTEKVSELRVFEFISNKSNLSKELKRKLFEVLHGQKPKVEVPRPPTVRTIR